MGTSLSVSTAKGFLGFLLGLFIALKLTHVIGWSWWMIFSPLWLPAVFAVVCIGLWLWIDSLSR